MPMERVEVTRRLRHLIKMMRTDRAQLTQRAAAELVGMSEIWWRQIESGHIEYAPAETLARMCMAVGVTPLQLRNTDSAKVAELVELRTGVLGDEGDVMEAHLLRTPGLTDAQRVALITMAKVLRSGA